MMKLRFSFLSMFISQAHFNLTGLSLVSVPAEKDTVQNDVCFIRVKVLLVMLA
jgi:hypothetical protein